MPAVQALRETKKANSSSMWRMACAAILLCFVTAVAASAQTFTTLADFPFQIGSVGDGPGLVQGIDGNFYGVTNLGGATNSACGGTCGTIFKVTPTGTLTILHEFCADSSCNGWDPFWLIRGGDGNFYGTTIAGGGKQLCAAGCGTMFKITPTGTFNNLYNFCSLPNCADGGGLVSLVQAIASGGGSVFGDFYGVTQKGGANGRGTAFRITNQGQLTTLHSFCAQTNCSDGEGPGTLMQDVGGNFYGVATAGLGSKSCNSFECAVFFRMTPEGAVTTLHYFDTPSFVNGPVVKGTDGFFYATNAFSENRVADLCSSEGCGTVIKLSAGGQLTTIYDFCSQTGCTDGAQPTASLIQATDGNFYGSTILNGCAGGAAGNCGTLFMITPGGTLTTLHNFCAEAGCTDGTGVVQKLVQGTDGKFYGMTSAGQPFSQVPTVFSLDAGLPPFVAFLVNTGKVGNTVGILGQGFTGTTAVSFNGTAATFTVKSDTYLTATVPTGATTGSVTVTTPSGTLNSNVAYRVTP